MVVVSPAVEPHKFHLGKNSNIVGSWVYHPDNGLIFAGILPVNQEQVRKYLTVEENQNRFVLCLLESVITLLRFKMHLAYQLDAIIALIMTLACKRQNSVSHIRNIIR